MTEYTEKLKNRRFVVVKYFLVIIWVFLVYRLFYVQVYCGSDFELLSKNQHFKEEKIPSRRGDILDRHGKKLATDLAYYEFSAEPPRIKDSWKVATVFAQNLEKSRDDYLKILDPKKKFVYLDRKVPAQKAEKILQRDLRGVRYTTEFKRYWPHGDITGQVIGFTNVDNTGIEGLELRFDAILAGIQGMRIATTDALGNHKTDFNYPVQKPLDGNTIITTLDLDCQTIAVEELSKAIKKYSARSGTVILMAPKTGEILAMASLPAFDSNKPTAVQPNLRKNRSINDTFEPGSIFKLVTAAAALELGFVTPEEEIYCEDGQITLGNRVFRDSKPHGILTVQEVIEKSSNIGTYKIAEKVGAENIYKFTKQFGFASKTGIELGGESPGILRKPEEWTSHSLASIAIGHEISVNALQIVNAYAVAANGGNLMKPYIVKAITDPSGTVLQEFIPQKIRRVISEKTSDTLTGFFEGVVDHGTGVSAKIQGNTIAGKTGTAQKVNPATKSYSNSEFVSSFVAYYPSRDPKIVGIVIIDTPKGTHYGGTVAAPAIREIFKRIAHIPDNTLFSSNSSPPGNEQKQDNLWQRFTGFLRSIFAVSSTSATQPQGLNGEYSSENKQAQGTENKQVQSLPLLVPSDRDTNEGNIESGSSVKNPVMVEVPDVVGMPMRDAMKILMQNSLDFEIAGSGLVNEQSPVQGKKVNSGSVIYLRGK